MPGDLLLGLDASTTSVKAVVFDTAGVVVSAGRAGVDTLTPRPAWHEQRAGQWWQSACAALRQAVQGIDPRRLAGMSISIQRETFVLVDGQGRELGSALVWMDERAASLLSEIDARCGADKIHAASGKPLSANLTLSKLYWILKNNPARAEAARGVWDVHAYLSARLCGSAVTSWGCADPGGLLDMPRRAWNEDLIRALGYDPAIFPPLFAPGQICGRVSAGAAQETGLPEGLPLAAGLGDGQAAALGAGVTKPGEAFLNLGTAVVSGLCADEYTTDRAFRTHFAGMNGYYDLETVLLGGTYTISWFLERFVGTVQGKPARAEEFEALALAIPPGAHGLVLVPYWNSAMSPYWDPHAPGLVVGWRGVHTPAHLYRAILEGIAFELRLQLEAVAFALGAGKQAVRLTAVGGGAASPLWRQIIADISGLPLVLAAEREASALGAAMLAGSGVGLFASPAEAARAMAHASSAFAEPEPARRAFYSDLFNEVYQPLFPAVRPVVDRLAKFADGL